MNNEASEQWVQREGYDGPGSFPKQVMGFVREKSTALVGLEHSLYLSDGRVQRYKFKDKDFLSMTSEKGGHGYDANDVSYRAYEAAPDIFIVSHTYPENERLNSTVILDFNRDQVVIVDNEIPDEGDDDFRVRQTHIGGCIGEPECAAEIIDLQFPTDLIGRRIAENYGDEYHFETIFLDEERLVWRCLKGNPGLADVEEYSASQFAHDVVCVSWTEHKETLAPVMLINFSDRQIYADMVSYNPDEQEIINIAIGGDLIPSSEFGVNVRGLSNTESQDTLQRNKDVVLRTHNEFWNRGKYELADELYADEYFNTFLCEVQTHGKQGMIDFTKKHKAAFPDWTERVVDIFAEGDRVVARYVSTGTHEGEFEGIPATGKKVKVNEVSIYKLHNGKVVEQWGFPDGVSLFKQLTED